MYIKYGKSSKELLTIKNDFFNSNEKYLDRMKLQKFIKSNLAEKVVNCVPHK